jgi:hypothetical protein
MYRQLGGFGSSIYAAYLPNRNLAPKLRDLTRLLSQLRTVVSPTSGHLASVA